MKKTTLLMLMAIFIVCCACDKAPETEHPKTLTGTWQSVHHYFSLTTDLTNEELKEKIEKLMDVDVAEADSYKLTFEDDGTGSGTNVRHDGKGRYGFNFSWQSGKLSDLTTEDPVLDDNTKADNSNDPILDIDPDADALRYDWDGAGDGYGGVFLTYNGTALETMGWIIEEFTADKLVLMTISVALADSDSGPWEEIHIYRYTFKKIE